MAELDGLKVKPLTEQQLEKRRKPLGRTSGMAVTEPSTSRRGGTKWYDRKACINTSALRESVENGTSQGTWLRKEQSLVLAPQNVLLNFAHRIAGQLVKNNKASRMLEPGKRTAHSVHNPV